MDGIIYDAATGSFLQNYMQTPMLGEWIVAYIGKERVSPKRVVPFCGEDDFGAYEGYYCQFVPNKHEESFDGTVRIYKDFAVFETVYAHGFKNSKNEKYKRPYIGFPVFEGHRWDDRCAMLSYKSQAPFNYPLQWRGTALESLTEGAHNPLIIMNESYKTVILSPVDHLIHNHSYIDHQHKNIRCGLSRHLKETVSGDGHKTLLMWGTGINRTIDRYGEVFRKFHGSRPVPLNGDVLLKYLSYWTNAGSAYWYRTLKGTGYDETLERLKDHHEHVGLTFGSYQLDSWWYNREDDTYTAGITHWQPRVLVKGKNYNAMLPFFQRYRSIHLFNGKRLSEIQNSLKKPIGCHYKQISNEAIYVKRAPKDYIRDTFAMPKNYKIAKQLFQEIFDQPDWEMAYIVHDWLQWMEDHHKGFRKLQVGEDYLRAMDDALLNLASKHNDLGHLTLQLCMIKPGMTLSASSMASVTTIRSTCDADSFFIEGTKRWWWHLYSARLIHTMGKYPFFDNRYSNAVHRFSFKSHPGFEMIYLALGCGPIGLGDRIGKENISLIRRVVRQDGEILKPDRYGVPADGCYLYNANTPNAKNGIVFYSSTDLLCGDSFYKVIYVLQFSVHPRGKRVTTEYRLGELEPSANGQWVCYDYLNRLAEVVEADSVIRRQVTSRRFAYHILSELRYGRAWFGMISKHIAASGQLFAEIHIDQNHILVLGNFPDDGPLTYAFYSVQQPISLTVRFLDDHHQVIRRLVMTNDWIVNDGLFELTVDGIFNQSYEIEVVFA